MGTFRDLLDPHCPLPVVSRRGRLVLVTGLVPATLRGAIERVGAARGWNPLWVGERLSRDLLDMPPERRGRAAHDWLKAEVLGERDGPLLLGGLDLLFEPSLGVAVLPLLQRASRPGFVVAGWHGRVRGGEIEYAVPGHRRFARASLGGLTAIPAPETLD